NHGCAATLAHAGIKRLHCHSGRDGLPKAYRQRNQRGRCRLRFSAQRQSGHRPPEVKAFLDQTIVEASTARPPGVAPSHAAARLVSKKVVEKDHGRLETREYFQSAELSWFADQDQWEGLQSVGLVQATRE